MFLLKLVDKNSLLNIFFSCLNVMIKTMENCMASQVDVPFCNVSRKKKEKLLCFLQQNNRIKRTFYYMKKNTKIEITLRPNQQLL